MVLIFYFKTVVSLQAWNFHFQLWTMQSFAPMSDWRSFERSRQHLSRGTSSSQSIRPTGDWLPTSGTSRLLGGFNCQWKPKPTVDRPLPTSLHSDLVALLDKAVL